MEEQFNTIIGLESYLIGSEGNVLSLLSGIKVKRAVSTLKSGYKVLNLSYNKGFKTFYLHRLVAKAHIANPNKKETVNHIDGNKANNNVSNLEWATRSENSKHGYDNGLIKMPWQLDAEERIKRNKL